MYTSIEPLWLRLLDSWSRFGRDGRHLELVFSERWAIVSITTIISNSIVSISISIIIDIMIISMIIIMIRISLYHY